MSDHERAEWIEGTLSLGAKMLEKRKRFSSHREFSAWLSENGIDYLSRNTLLALLEMSKDPERFRIVLEQTERSNLMSILKYEFHR